VAFRIITALQQHQSGYQGRAAFWVAQCCTRPAGCVAGLALLASFTHTMGQHFVVWLGLYPLNGVSLETDRLSELNPCQSYLLICAVYLPGILVPSREGWTRASTDEGTDRLGKAKVLNADDVLILAGV